jgi:hypothetical protein
MGSVTYRKVGSRWHIRFREQGEEKVKTYDGSLPEYAIERKSRWFKQEWERGYYNPFENREKDIELTNAIDKYCNYKRRKGDWNAKTARISKERLRQSADHVGRQQVLSDLRSADFQEWINSLSGSPYTRKSYRSTLNTFLKWCFNRNYTPRLFRVKLPSDDREQIQSVDEDAYISIDQLQTLSNYLHNAPPEFISIQPKHITDIWGCMFWQLLQADEVLAIRPEHIFSDPSRICIRTGEEETIKLPLVPPARKIVHSYIQKTKSPANSLFGIDSTDTIQKTYEWAMHNCYPDQSPDLRQLRRGGIIHYLKLGKPIQYVSRLARHPDIPTTVRKYASHIPDRTREAFEDLPDSPLN